MNGQPQPQPQPPQGPPQGPPQPPSQGQPSDPNVITVKDDAGGLHGYSKAKGWTQEKATNDLVKLGNIKAPDPNVITVRDDVGKLHGYSKAQGWTQEKATNDLIKIGKIKAPGGAGAPPVAGTAPPGLLQRLASVDPVSSLSTGAAKGLASTAEGLLEAGVGAGVNLLGTPIPQRMQ